MDFNTSVAHPARVYNYWLGGKDNFAADRDAAQEAIAAFPQVISSVLANRAFLGRAVRFLAAEARIRQFLDIGTGLPTADNTHQVAQEVTPDCRVVYTDNDPIVLAHARALLTGSLGTTSYVDADIRDTDTTLEQSARSLDFNLPVAIVLLGILQLVPDSGDPYAIVGKLTDVVCPGSYLVISHPTGDIDSDAMTDMARRLTERSSPAQMTLRTHTQVSRFFRRAGFARAGIGAGESLAPAPGRHSRSLAIPQKNIHTVPSRDAAMHRSIRARLQTRRWASRQSSSGSGGWSTRTAALFSQKARSSASTAIKPRRVSSAARLDFADAGLPVIR